MAKKRKCRTCKKEYLVPSVFPGCCSALCLKKRKLFLANTRPIPYSKSQSLKMKRLTSREFLLSREWKEVRYKTLRKYGFSCMACGAKPPGVILHVDHIKPRSKFPQLSLDEKNLQVLCELCNQGKSNRYFDDLT